MNVNDLLIYKDDLHHLGNLNISERSGSSLEGNALSVSPCPDAWAKIHRIPSNQVHSIKPDYFIDMFKAEGSGFIEKAIEFCINNKFVKAAKKYSISWFDDELDSEVTAIFDTKEEATLESDAMETEISPVDTFDATDKMLTFFDQKSIYCTSINDFMLMLYFIKNHNIKNFYWDEKLDVYAYSAPRGAMFDFDTNANIIDSYILH